MAAADAKEAAAAAQSARRWRETLRSLQREQAAWEAAGRRAAGDDAGGAAADGADGSVERFEHLEAEDIWRRRPLLVPNPAASDHREASEGQERSAWLEEAALRSAEGGRGGGMSRRRSSRSSRATDRPPPPSPPATTTTTTTTSRRRRPPPPPRAPPRVRTRRRRSRASDPRERADRRRGEQAQASAEASAAARAADDEWQLVAQEAAELRPHAAAWEEAQLLYDVVRARVPRRRAEGLAPPHAGGAPV